MILLVNICKEKLHYYEFVKSVEDILKRAGKRFFVKTYLDVRKDDLERAEKVIICGTGLLDNSFLSNLDSFNWLKDFEKPVLGICGGMQVVGLVFDGKLKKKLEVGFFKEFFDKDFLGLGEEQEVYHLHQNYVLFSEDFEIFTKGKVPQAVKHKERDIYGVLFHPEVRQKDLIRRFVR